MATKVESDQAAEKLDNVLTTWESLLESGAFELAQRETTALRRLISASATPKKAENALELEMNTVWLRHQATLWYRWVPVLCQAVRGEQAGSCSLLCFLFEDARGFLFPLCGLAKSTRCPKPGRPAGSSNTAVHPSWPTFVPVSERYRMHLELVYHALGTALGVVRTPEPLDAVTVKSGKGVADNSTWLCQLMRCLGVVVQNTPSRCLPIEQLGTLQQWIWEQYALSVGREVETLRAAALSCLKTIHTRLRTFPPLSLLLEDQERWNDIHVVSFVEAMLALRTHLRESRHLHDREDVQTGELVMQMIHHHLERSSTASSLRLQSARLLRQMLRLHPQLGETQKALTLNLLRDSFHAVRVVAVDCLTLPNTGLDSQMMFVEFQTLTRDPTAAMRAAACTALGRIPVADSVTELISVNSADVSTPRTDTTCQRILNLLAERFSLDPNTHVRAAAAAALGNLCSRHGHLSSALPESTITAALEELERAPYSSHASAYCRFLAAVTPNETQRVQIVSLVGRILRGARRKQLRYHAATALARHLQQADDTALWSPVAHYRDQNKR